ncbi:16S rRNA (guanine(527)-N(7))-methyltransferase RsmG [Desulforhopalus vacuolatus]|uniref:16S rRNA (guanine(527)-N(7))-methyltransferase RsmG n=1 Tax=Desulforhopalus vacuolatus TaxID=40414 RepID=UPI0019633287|nr:16S rRNA (guanine(527)-N(7))-methyltransferase RsmG [Desulforhopalus vacuolatus]MBM9518564.1 16S rRNA (guanine(527)-N(7))-methyltransferase RsmG [Desulforhopalus vacuolatus]
MTESRLLLEKGLSSLGSAYAPAPERLALLENYCAELLKWRGRINLVAKTASVEDIVEKHFLDSLTLLPELTGNCHLLDIGTGAGFPGLVCRTAMPTLGLTLVEPRQKRVNFLRHVIRTLGLSQEGAPLVVREERLEADSPLTAEKFSHITCRAVTDVGSFLELVTAFQDATLLLMKGPKWKEELKAASVIMEKNSYRLKDVRKIILPFSKAERFVLTILHT